MATIDINLGSFDLNSTNSIAVADIKLDLARSLKQSDLAKVDGSVIPISKRKSITAKVNGTIKGTDYTDLRTKVDALLAALEDDAEQKLTLDDGRFLYVQFTNFSQGWRNFRTLMSFSFNLVASDPFWYSQTLNADTRDPTSGVSYNLTNAGNAPARVKTTVRNHSGSTITDNIKIENVTTGEIWQFEGSLLNNKLLVLSNRVDIDYVLFQNDGVNAEAYFYGDLLSMNPGVNALKYTGPANVEVKTEWRDSWF